MPKLSDLAAAVAILSRIYPAGEFNAYNEIIFIGSDGEHSEPDISDADKAALISAGWDWDEVTESWTCMGS